MSKITGLIYKIYNTKNDKLFIGYTTIPLNRILCFYKSNARLSRRQDKILSAMNSVGIENFYIEEIMYKVVLKKDIKKIFRKLKQKYIDKYDSINNGYNSNNSKEFDNIKYQKEYYSENLDKCKKYYTNNIEKITKQKKVLYNNNKEKMRKKGIDFYNKNKDKINKKNREKVVCECGAIVSWGCLTRHKKTSKKHLKNMTKKENDLNGVV